MSYIYTGYIQGLIDSRTLLNIISIKKTIADKDYSVDEKFRLINLAINHIIEDIKNQVEKNILSNRFLLDNINERIK